MEAANGGLVQLKTVANPQAFHPENLASAGGRHQPTAPFVARHFEVGEKVLQFRRPDGTDGMETVTRLPMAQANLRPYLLGIKMLVVGLAPKGHAGFIGQFPVKLNVAEADLTAFLIVDADNQ